MWTSKQVIAVVTALSPLAAMAACSSNNSTPATTTTSTSSGSTSSSSSAASSSGASTSSTSSSSSSSGVAVADAGDAGDASESADAGGTPCSDAGTLYSRLGGHSGIRGAIDAIVAAELADPEIASYFFFQAAGAAGHPNPQQIEECFTDLLAANAGGTETYPPDGGVTDDAGNVWHCRDMVTIHAPLLISGGTFDRFITIAAGVLGPDVSSCDLDTIASVLEGTRSAIVTSSLADAGLESFPGDAAALISSDAAHE
jgi:hypothetical protein